MELQTIWDSTELPQIFLSFAYWQDFPWFLLLLLTTGANLWLGCVFCSSFSVLFNLLLLLSLPVWSKLPAGSWQQLLYNILQDQASETHWKGTRGSCFLSQNLLSRQLWYAFLCLTGEQIPVCNRFFNPEQIFWFPEQSGALQQRLQTPRPLPACSCQRSSQDSLLCLCFMNVTSLSQMNVTFSSQD